MDIETVGANDLEGRRESAGDVRRRVIDQHVKLRGLLKAGLEQVQGGEPTDVTPLRRLIGVTYDVLAEHLADEEALVLPILEDDCPLGPLRAERLREEHAQQISEMRALRAWAESGNVAALATRFRDLALVLLGDIEDEDRELLVPDVIRDDRIVIDVGELITAPGRSRRGRH